MICYDPWCKVCLNQRILFVPHPWTPASFYPKYWRYIQSQKKIQICGNVWKWFNPSWHFKYFLSPFSVFPLQIWIITKKKKRRKKTYLWVIKLGEVFVQHRQITRISLIKNINFKFFCWKQVLAPPPSILPLLLIFFCMCAFIYINL